MAFSAGTYAGPTIATKRRYVNLQDETDWAGKRNLQGVGGSPPSITSPGTAYHLPCTYSVTTQAETRHSEAMAGTYQRVHGKRHSLRIAGQLQTSLFGWVPSGRTESLAQSVMDWGFGQHEDKFVRSKTVQFVEDVTNISKAHYGLRCNQATLSGQAGTDPIQLSLDLMGHSEALLTSPAALPNARNKMVDFQMAETQVQIDDAWWAVLGFQWQLQRGLTAHHMSGSQWPSHITKSQHVETLQLTLFKEDDVWDAFQRASGRVDGVINLRLKGLHNGTGTVDTNWTVCTIAFPVAMFVSATDGESGGMATKQLNFVNLDADGNTNCSSMTWSEEA